MKLKLLLATSAVVLLVVAVAGARFAGWFETTLIALGGSTLLFVGALLCPSGFGGRDEEDEDFPWVFVGKYPSETTFCWQAGQSDGHDRRVSGPEESRKAA